MTIASTPRSALRSATAACHDRVDRVFSTARLDDRADYGRFLLAQAAAHFAAETALEHGGIGTIVLDWPSRRRSAAMRADLAELGIAPPAALAMDALASEAALLGALYVLEGSRLGGTMLARSVAPGLPVRFLGGVHSGAWRDLLAMLDARLATPEQLEIAIQAARAVFALFEASGRAHLNAAQRDGGDHPAPPAQRHTAG